jgi:hypothetical protein
VAGGSSVAGVSSLSDYINPKSTLLPPPAVKADWATGPALNAAGPMNIKGNDTLGDCVEAACGNIIDIWHADAGTGISVTAAQTVAFYSLTSGYRGTPATDQGSDEITVAEDWIKEGFAPDLTPCAAYVLVNPANPIEVRTAIDLFGNIMICGALLTAWVSAMATMKSGFTWDVGSAADLKAGHGFTGYGYNANGVFIVTWGMFGTITWKALAAIAATQAGGNLLCFLSPDWFNKAGMSPSGFNRTQLAGDIVALTQKAA